VGVAIDHKIVVAGGHKRFQGPGLMKKHNPPTGKLEFMGTKMDLPHTGKALPKIKLIPIVIPKHPHQIQARLTERLSRKRGNEVARMQNEIHPTLPKKPKTPAKVRKVIVSIGNDPNQHKHLLLGCF
jgi:hypothetical protein